jgi:dihydroneopterin aldolase
MQKRHHIRLHNAVFFGYHGNYAEERSLGARFHIDVDICTDFTEAAKGDDLSKTVNYEAVYLLIQNLVTNHSFKLLESMAWRIAREILDHFAEAESVNVRVRKPGVPIKGAIDTVEVEVDEHR